MRTWLTERFGLSVPVVAAPMAGVSTGRLAAAVSAAGGLGMLGVGATATPDWVRGQCALAREAGPFGVELMPGRWRRTTRSSMSWSVRLRYWCP